MKEFEERVKQSLQPFTDVPILFISVIEKQRIHKAVETFLEVYDNLHRKIPTHKLNDVMLEVIQKYEPPAIKGKHIRIKFVTQLPTRSVSFAFFCNLPQYISDAYRRYLENQLRLNFNFHGVPIRIYFRKK